MRFVVRMLSLIFLVLAVLAGLVDAIQSVAAGQLVLNRMIETWSVNSPDTLVYFQDLFTQHLPAPVWDIGVRWILQQPTSAVFLMVSLIFYLVGYRRAKPAGRFAA